MAARSALVPILEWLPKYERANFRYDLIAGVSVSALVVPKALGYAGIAEVPLENGLYAAAFGAIVYAVFCTSRQISTGPSSALAAVAGSAVVTAGVVDTPDAAELVAAVTILTGLLFLALAVLRMGWIARFLSKPVVTGFLFGAAIDVVVGELPKLSGTSAEGRTVWAEFFAWLDTIGDFHTTTFVVGVIALATILALRFLVPKLPGALVLVVGGIVASVVFDLSDRGVATVGDVPRGLPVPDLPSWQLLLDHIGTIGTAAGALVLIGLSQTAGDARVFAARHQYQIDVDQETVAQGMANIAAGTFQGMPVSTSLSASSLNDSAGARTPMASIVTGLAVVLTLLALAPLFSDLPKAVLGALIIDAVVFGMIDIPEMRRYWRVKKFDFWIAALAMFGVLASGVLAGVIVGMVLSLGWLVYVSVNAEIPELGRRPNSTLFRPLDEFPDGETFPGILVMRFRAGLYFATADALEDRLRDALEEGDSLRTVVIDCSSINFVDAHGSEKVTQIIQLADQAHVSLRLARVHPAVRSILEADGVIARLGDSHVHSTVDHAVQSALADQL